MEQNAVKNLLPTGWIVASSKRYPDRIYYFNVITGASSWECPILNSSSVETTKVECHAKEPVSVKRPYEMIECGKNAESFKTSKDVEKCSRNLLPEFKTLKRSRKDNAENESLCSSVPPTAVVNPVVNERYVKSEIKPVSSLPFISNKSEHKKLMKRNQRKRRRLRQEEKKRNVLLGPSVCDVVTLNTADQVNELNVSVLEPYNEAQNDDMENLSSISTNSYTITNETDSGFIEDIEMLDVSEDLTKIEDLTSDEACSDGFNSYYIVVDTNVFIQELRFIDEIKDTPVEGCGPPHIFIPWVVIQELDSLKRSNKASSGRKAIEAVRYLNSVLIAKHPRFHGQSAKEFEEWSQKYSKCNDDRILECCVSLAEKMPREKVILLTHDKNLANKALVCDIVVHNLESVMKALKPDVIYKGTRDNSPNSQRKAVVKGSNILVSLVPGDVGSSESKVSQESESAERNAKKKLRKQQDAYKRKIHSHMSTARQLLKDALEPFLEAEMDEAYGEAWKAFAIDRRLLRGILGAIIKYWKTVFTFNFSEKDKRNFTLLHQKVSRPEGFFGDRDECLSILTAIEDVFCQIKRRWPLIAVCIEKIQDLRATCADLFQKKREIENSISNTEYQNALSAFDFNWIIINRLCGMVMDFCQIPHDFDYAKPDVLPPAADFSRLMCNLYPAVQQLKQVMSSMFEALKKSAPTKKIFIKLHKCLKDFIPSLEIETDFPALPHFTPESLQNFCLSASNRQLIENGYKQLEIFNAKLHEALGVMMASKQNRAPGLMQLE